MKDLFEEMRHMHQEMDRMFANFFGNKQLPGKDVTSLTPAKSDVIEKDSEVVAKFDLPGIDKKDIKLKVTEDSIKVSAERKKAFEVKEEDFFRHERSFQGFFRQLPLPVNVRPEEAIAEYKDGVLVVKMPKSDKAKVKSFDVEVR